MRDDPLWSFAALSGVKWRRLTDNLKLYSVLMVLCSDFLSGSQDCIKLMLHAQTPLIALRGLMRGKLLFCQTWFCWFTVNEVCFVDLWWGALGLVINMQIRWGSKLWYGVLRLWIANRVIWSQVNWWSEQWPWLSSFSLLPFAMFWFSSVQALDEVEKGGLVVLVQVVLRGGEMERVLWLLFSCWKGAVMEKRSDGWLL